MTKLLATGKTDLLENFVSNKTRRKFKARLAWDTKEGKVIFEFEPRPERKAGGEEGRGRLARRRRQRGGGRRRGRACAGEEGRGEEGRGEGGGEEDCGEESRGQESGAPQGLNGGGRNAVSCAYILHPPERPWPPRLVIAAPSP